MEEAIIKLLVLLIPAALLAALVMGGREELLEQVIGVAQQGGQAGVFSLAGGTTPAREERLLAGQG